MINKLRWLAFVPLALLASLLVGAAATWLTELFGGAAWYVWLVSGAASAWAFFFVALHVAPAISPVVKWVSVIVVGVLGLVSALGALMAGREPIRAITGAVMVGFAVYYARRPTAAVKADVAP